MRSHRAPAPSRHWTAWTTVLVLVLVAALAAMGIVGSATASSPNKGPLQAAPRLAGERLQPAASAPEISRPLAAAHGVCGSQRGRAPHIRHVVWVVLENRSYSEVMHAPYISSLAAQCGVATNYHNISHPSLPNYVAMTSGRPMSGLPTTDCPTLCPLPGPSIFTQTTSWHVYAESMPGNCVRQDAWPYVVHHTAAPYYTAVSSCASNDVPLTALNVAALPAFSMIVPNVIHDMHPGSSSVAAGDTWLRSHLTPIFSSAAYLTGETVVFVTWDEGGTPRTTNSCALNTISQGCHVALLAANPYIPSGSRWSVLANHYSLLKVTEQLLGLPYLGQAATAPSLQPSLGL